MFPPGVTKTFPAPYRYSRSDWKFVPVSAPPKYRLTVKGDGGPLPRALSFTAISVALFGMLLAREAVDGWRRRQRGLADRRLGRREWVLVLLGLALVAALLSLGPVVNLARRPIGSGLYAWLHPYLLPLRALRAANRIGVLVVFAVSLLASLGVTWLRAHLPRRAFIPVVTALGVLLALEYATFPLAYGRVPALARPVDRALRDAPASAVILEWPAYVPMTDADAMFRSLGFDPEALLEDHVRDSSGELHDLMILSHSVQESWGSMLSTGIVEGLSG
jgi:hypothetical protein